MYLDPLDYKPKLLHCNSVFETVVLDLNISKIDSRELIVFFPTMFGVIFFSKASFPFSRNCDWLIKVTDVIEYRQRCTFEMDRFESNSQKKT